MTGLESFLNDLARVTSEDGTAIFDGYDPTRGDVEKLLGYRSDPAQGLAHRVMTFEYEGDIDPILYFRLFSPAQLREATQATAWSVADSREQ